MRVTHSNGFGPSSRYYTTCAEHSLENRPPIDSRQVTLAVTAGWSADLSMVGRPERRKALTKVGRSLVYVAIGLAWVTGWAGDPITAWLLGGYLVVMLAYDVSALRRSRKRRTSDCQTS